MMDTHANDPFDIESLRVTEADIEKLRSAKKGRLSEILETSGSAWKTSVNGGNRSHDKTLLAKLGGCDDDRKSEVHDQACQFLLQSHVALKLADALLGDMDLPLGDRLSGKVRQDRVREMWATCKECSRSYCSYPLSAVSRFLSWRLVEARNELLLCKGEGKYQSTIGFCDVVLTVTSDREFVGDARCLECKAWKPEAAKNYDKHSDQEYRIGIEVKAGRVQISEVIRQIALYRQHLRAHVWALATPWAINEAEKTALTREKIRHVLLGPEFDRFVQELKACPESQSDVTL